MQRDGREGRGIFFRGGGGGLRGGITTTLREIISQTDSYLVSLSSKTYVFEDKMTKY